MIIDSLSYEVLATMLYLNKPEPHQRQEYSRFKNALGLRYSDMRSKVTHEADKVDPYDFLQEVQLGSFEFKEVKSIFIE